MSMPFNEDLPHDRDAIIARLDDVERELRGVREAEAANRHEHLALMEQLHKLEAERMRMLDILNRWIEPTRS
jgi:hypothetical protein